jgi:4'-phosphopantetheinyl transferase
VGAVRTLEGGRAGPVRRRWARPRATRLPCRALGASYDGAVDATGAAGSTSATPSAAGQPPQRHWWAGHEAALPDGLDWLSPRELARLGDMRFTKRRNEYLLRRWVGKRTLAARVGLDTDPASLAGIEVLNRVSGAPFVVVAGAPAPWDISLSDRAGCAVAVISASGSGAAGSGAAGSGTAGPSGIDLELVEARSEGFISDFLTRAEGDWVRGPAAAEPGLGQDAAANLVWSAKEAALKVLHLGLRADTRSVEISVESGPRVEGWARFVAARPDGRVLHGWWRRDGRFLLTVASRGELEPPAVLPGAADLALAAPVHSWVGRPTVTRGE